MNSYSTEGNSDTSRPLKLMKHRIETMSSHSAGGNSVTSRPMDTNGKHNKNDELALWWRQLSHLHFYDLVTSRPISTPMKTDVKHDANDEFAQQEDKRAAKHYARTTMRNYA